MKRILLSAALAVAPVFCMTSSPALAQDSVYTPSGYWNVQGIYLEPGQFENYMDYVADRYRKSQDYSRSKGWITGYRILVNVNRRQDEPNLYLITEMPRLATPQEDIEREKMFNQAMAETTRQAEEGSGKRVSMRRLGSNLLLQELMLKPAK